MSSFRSASCIKVLFIFSLIMMMVISSAACKSNNDNIKIGEVEALNRLDDGVPLIPRLGSIKIDGSNEDWLNVGYTIDLAADSYNRHTDLFDYKAKITLGWNSSGLCLYADVEDDVIFTYPNKNTLIHGDNINITLSGSKGGDDFIFFVLSPDTAGNKTMINVEYNMEVLKGKEPKISAICRETDKGYAVEALIPFDNINITPENKKEIAIQISAYDSDYIKDSRRALYPWYQTHDISSTDSLYTVRLSDKHFYMHSPDVKGHIDDENLYITLRSFSGEYKNVSVYNGSDLLVSEAVSKDKEGRIYADAAISLSDIKDDDLKLNIHIDDNLNRVIELKGIKTNPENYKQPEYPFESDVMNYVKQDEVSPPEEGVIVFAGSSSFTLWGTVVEDMKPLNVINRSFGGSEMYQVTHFADKIILPYKPSKIVVYEGDNDMLGKTPEMFIGECKSFVRKIHHYLPDTEIYFVSVKMSPIREAYWPKYEMCNKMLKEFSDETDKVEFIDVVPAMMDENGNVNHGYFADDLLHISPEGYELWTSIIKPRISD